MVVYVNWFVFMPKLIDMIGKKFNKLLVLRDSGMRGARNRIKYVCLCDCGNESFVFGEPLRSGHTKSCGCEKIKATTKHGKYGSGAYKTWDKMIQRCTNKNNHAYKHYGGKGIFVCNDWLNFKSFYEDMGERPKGMTIDRLNHEDGYYKENCVWVTQESQTQNTSRNIVVSISSKLITVRELAELSNRTYNNVNNILWKHANRVNKCYVVDDDLRDKFFSDVC